MFKVGEGVGGGRYGVLESAIADLFKTNGAAMVGQEIKIRGIPFEVVGVLTTKGTQGGFGSSDDDVLIPLETARYRVMGTDRLRTITINGASVDSLSLTLLDIMRVLRRQHKLRPGVDDNFRIRSARDV